MGSRALRRIASQVLAEAATLADPEIVDPSFRASNESVAKVGERCRINLSNW